MTPSPNQDATADAARTTGNEAWAIVSRMVAGMLIYGTAGWLVGSWLGSSMLGMAVGVPCGLALGLYLSVLRVQQLGPEAPALVVSDSQSWTARMTRARIERSSEVVHGD